MSNKFKLSMVSPVMLGVSMALMSYSSSAEEHSQRYIVKLKDNSVKQTLGLQPSLQAINTARVNLLQTTALEVNTQVLRALPTVNAMAVELTPTQLKALQQSDTVEYIEIDPKRYILDTITPQAESTPYGITMVQAQQVADTGNKKVCITDTGYTLNHPDLISTGVTGDARNGNSSTGNWYNDGNGHGTHVAGTIAGIGGNGQGVVGVNPDGRLPLHIVKVFKDDGSWGYGSDLVAAINQCVAAGADIISMSLGGGGASTAEQTAFQNAYNRGVLSIAAAGNDGNSSSAYPASYASVVSVAAVDSGENVASFSQYNRYVEIAGPGVSVNSTWNNNGYKSISGTSMATPHVAGVAALVWGNFPGCSNQQIRDALNETAKDKGSSGRDNYYGYGIVQAKSAYDYLQNSSCGNGGGGDQNQAPIANFTTAVNDLTATFTDASSDDKSVVGRNWSFGDGVSSSQANPTHTYAASGTYTVQLTVEDAEGLTNSKSKTVTVTEPGNGGGDQGCDGLANWNANTSYALGDSVAYNNKQYDAIWWSTGASPDVFSNVWRNMGDCSTGGGDGGNQNQAPVAKFTHTSNELSVSFKQSATDDVAVTRYSWNFGDGNSSITANPNHTYAAAGSYNVTLSVADAEGLTDALSKTVTVEANDGGGDGGNGGDCDGITAWSANNIYLNGDEVSYQGAQYQANWWTRNDDPAVNSGPWSVWTKLGACK